MADQTIVLMSGPAVSRVQARSALTRGGWEVVDGAEHRCGLDVDEPADGWLLATGPHPGPDPAVVVAGPLGWRLRLHHHGRLDVTDPTVDPVAVRLAELEDRLASIERGR